MEIEIQYDHTNTNENTIQCHQTTIENVHVRYLPSEQQIEAFRQQIKQQQQVEEQLQQHQQQRQREMHARGIHDSTNRSRHPSDTIPAASSSPMAFGQIYGGGIPIYPTGKFHSFEPSYSSPDPARLSSDLLLLPPSRVMSPLLGLADASTLGHSPEAGFILPTHLSPSPPVLLLQQTANQTSLLFKSGSGNSLAALAAHASNTTTAVVSSAGSIASGPPTRHVSFGVGGGTFEPMELSYPHQQSTHLLTSAPSSPMPPYTFAQTQNQNQHGLQLYSNHQSHHPLRQVDAMDQTPLDPSHHQLLTSSSTSMELPPEPEPVYQAIPVLALKERTHNRPIAQVNQSTAPRQPIRGREVIRATLVHLATPVNQSIPLSAKPIVRQEQSYARLGESIQHSMNHQHQSTPTVTSIIPTTPLPDLVPPQQEPSVASHSQLQSTIVKDREIIDLDYTSKVIRAAEVLRAAAIANAVTSTNGTGTGIVTSSTEIKVKLESAAATPTITIPQVASSLRIKIPSRNSGTAPPPLSSSIASTSSSNSNDSINQTTNTNEDMDVSVTDETSNSKSFKYNKHCTWPGCTARFPKESTLVRHIRVHTGERPYVCHISGCTSAFSERGNLVRHLSGHASERRFACPFGGYCLARFRRAAHVESHVQTRHVAFGEDPARAWCYTKPPVGSKIGDTHDQ